MASWCPWAPTRWLTPPVRSVSCWKIWGKRWVIDFLKNHIVTPSRIHRHRRRRCYCCCCCCCPHTENRSCLGAVFCTGHPIQTRSVVPCLTHCRRRTKALPFLSASNSSNLKLIVDVGYATVEFLCVLARSGCENYAHGVYRFAGSYFSGKQNFKESSPGAVYSIVRGTFRCLYGL